MAKLVCLWNYFYFRYYTNPHGVARLLCKRLLHRRRGAKRANPEKDYRRGAFLYRVEKPLEGKTHLLRPS